MEAFQGNYKFYYSLMCTVGLWPYNNSFLTKIYRCVIVLMLFGCIVNQLTTLRNTNMTLDDIIVQLTFCFSLLIYTVRYITFVFTLPASKYIVENMQKDYDMLKDPVELELLMKYSITAKRMVQLYFVLTCCGTAGVFITLGLSTVLQSDLQLHFLHLLGFYFNERSQRTNLTCWYIIIVEAYGLVTVTCTEGTITVFSTYLSGLLEIASYRMRNTVNRVANSDALNVIDLQPIVEIHCKAIRHSKKYTSDMMIASLLIVIVVIVAFGVNLYRLFMTITLAGKYDEVLLTIYFVGAYLSFIGGNNYSGQILLDSGINFYHETYNSLWYRIPPRMQKMVLLALMRSQVSVEFNLAGLFVPCYEGLTMVIDRICTQAVPMLSSSFSYFTLLCSVQ